MPPGESIIITRPVRAPSGGYLTMEVERCAHHSKHFNGLMVARGRPHIEFLPPPTIALDTTDADDILIMLEFAGVNYREPASPAARLGTDLFSAGRAFALESAPEWIGFDWDYTTNVYKIYGPLSSLIAMKVFRTPPRRIRRQNIRLFEAAKPGMHELIMGMAAGYALRQGLRSFEQWEYYRPQVRFVTQTWPDRLAQLGTSAFRIVALMMGRFPGRPITEEDIRSSDAFITVDDFLRQTSAMLTRFKDANFTFHVLSAREQDEVMELLRAGRGYRLKPLSTFAAKGWLPPSLIFDDSTTSNERLAKEGVRVVSVINPVVPGREISEIRALSLLGRRAAARAMVRMCSHTEGPAMIAALEDLRAGAKRVIVNPSQLAPSPEGSILTLFDIRGSIADLLMKFRQPQHHIDTLIREIAKKGGGIIALEKAYRTAASLRRPHMKTAR